MKIWIYLPLLCLCACSVSKPAQIRIKPLPTTLIPSEQIESVRYPEAVKPYSVGRYVDPANPSILHEHHTLYRVESMSSWNFHPSAEAFRPFTPADRAFSPAPVNDDVIAEVNRQKAMSRLMNQETEKLTHSLQNLQEALAATQSLAQQNQQLRQQLAEAEKRIGSLEQRWTNAASVSRSQE